MLQHSHPLRIPPATTAPGSGNVLQAPKSCVQWCCHTRSRAVLYEGGPTSDGGSSEAICNGQIPPSVTSTELNRHSWSLPGTVTSSRGIIYVRWHLPELVAPCLCTELSKICLVAATQRYFTDVELASTKKWDQNFD